MLTHYLQASIEDIENLIALTMQDICDIKEAKHQAIFDRTRIKNDLVRSFENKKSLLDNELLKLVNANKDRDLEDILDVSQKDMLSLIKEKLLSLRAVNKEYARFVVSVSEFYNSLLDSVFPREMEGYQRSHHKPASLLKIRA
ncbi:MAG: hypothetical protein IBX44_02355 [Sulfurospirillum sp.]|nr:hypothetical protein [Sulfurospirillum sp.]